MVTGTNHCIWGEDGDDQLSCWSALSGGGFMNQKLDLFSLNGNRGSFLLGSLPVDLINHAHALKQALY